MPHSQAANARMIQKIEKVIDQVDNDDRDVLKYIASQLTPEAIDSRSEWDKDMSHLHAVAKERLRKYNNIQEAQTT